MEYLEDTCGIQILRRLSLDREVPGLWALDEWSAINVASSHVLVQYICTVVQEGTHIIGHLIACYKVYMVRQKKSAEAARSQALKIVQCTGFIFIIHPVAMGQMPCI